MPQRAATPPPPSAGDAARLLACVRGFAGRRVAVLGDMVVDEFVHGDIARVSREAPVLILDHRRTVVVPGGGANSALATSTSCTTRSMRWLRSSV